MSTRLIGFCLILVGLFVISYPKPATAEIATTKDWIGLFATGAADGKANAERGCSTPDTLCWVYANSCNRIAGATPVLASAGCSNLIPNPLPPSGTSYEFRMYAYDQGGPEALIARSNAMTIAASGPGGGNPCPIQATNPRVINGLISAPNPGSNFGNSNATCVTGNPATFISFKIPGYADIKSIYYTQAKSTNPTFTKHTQINPVGGGDIHIDPNINLAGTKDHLYFVNGNLVKGTTESFPQDPSLKTGVVFVEGNFSINSNIGYTGALVFVVQGDINIDPSVTLINAVLISAGRIYTKGAGCTLSPAPGTDSRLIINGSLISLDSTIPISFCRRLADNSQAAELINNEPKYLVILRNLFSDTLQKWSEIQ